MPRITNTPGTRYSFKYVLFEKASEKTEKMGQDGWVLDGWELDLDNTSVVLAFTRPNEGRPYVIDSTPIRQRLVELRNDSLRRTDRVESPYERDAFRATGEATAYDRAIALLDKATGG